MLALRESRRGQFVGLRLRVEGRPVAKAKPKRKRYPEMVLEWPKIDGPKVAQDGPKMAQDGPKMTQDIPKMGQDGPR